MPKIAKKDLICGDEHNHEHTGSVSEKDKREFQQKYMQYQMAQQYLKALADEKTQLEARIAELSMTASSMKSVEKVKRGEEIWSTLGSDVFVSADIKDSTTAVVGVGAGVYIRKPIAEAVKTIEARYAELVEVNKQLVMEMTMLAQQMQKLEPEIQAMMAQLQSEK